MSAFKIHLKHISIALCLGIGIGCIGLSFMIFYIGFHNLDLSVNILRISYYEDLRYNDYYDVYNLEGDIISYDDAYILGSSQMQGAHVLALLGGMFLGVGLMMLSPYFKKEIEDEKFFRKI